MPLAVAAVMGPLERAREKGEVRAKAPAHQEATCPSARSPGSEGALMQTS